MFVLDVPTWIGADLVSQHGESLEQGFPCHSGLRSPSPNDKANLPGPLQ